MFPVIFLSNTGLIFLGGLVLYYVIADVVSMQQPRLYIWGSSFISTVLWTINQYFLPAKSSAMDLVSSGFAILSIALFAPKGRKWLGTVTMTVLLAVQIGSSFALGLVAFPIANRMGYPSEELYNITTSFGSAIMSLILLCLLIPLYHWFGRVMGRMFRGIQFSPTLLCFLPIPISQTILMNIINRVLPIVHNVDDILISYSLAILLAVAADVVFFVGTQKIRQTSLLREQVQMVSQQLDVQTSYYRQLQESILTINQIRHDLNNQLQAAYHLLEIGETAQARHQLDQVQDSLCHQPGARFSSNLMIDAVLQGKAKCCQEQGIPLSVSAEIPPEIPVENAHLCSVFSNLLDNSIHGAVESGAAEKGISLQAVVRNHCLIIHCSNPANKPKQSKNQDLLRQHGLGLEILSKIASVYQGSVHTSYQNGWFHASVYLPLASVPERGATYAD